MRLSSRVLVPLGVLLVAVAAGAGDRDGDAAGAADPRGAVTFIGDSTMAGMGSAARDEVEARYDLTFEAASCRRLVIPSCGRTVQHPNTLDVMRSLDGRLGDAVVVMAGYDDWQIDSAVDVIVGEAERQLVPLVLWVTYRTGVGYTGPGGVSNDATFRQFNGVLAAKQAEHPSLRLADWDTHARGRDTWFAPDGIHLTPEGAMALARFLVAELDTLPVGRCRADGAVAGEAVAPGAAPVNGEPGGFTAAEPERLADTRLSAPLAAGRVMPVEVGGAGSVPANATGALVNVTAVDACAPGYLTAFPCGGGVPLASNLNYVTGETRANVATVRLGDGGRLCVHSSARTDVLVDLVGWFSPDDGVAITPTAHRRLLDTRGAGSRPAARSWMAVSAPAGLALVTVTVTEPTGAGFVSVAPAADGGGSCEGQTPASTLNYRRAQTVANVAAVEVGAGGRLCVFTWSDAHLVVDLIGTDGPGGALVSPVPPLRLLDTRTTGAPGRVAAGGAIAIDAPTGSSAVVVNVTAADASAAGYVTAFPAAADGSCDASRAPLASSLNPAPGPPVAAMVIVPTGGLGRACLATSSAVDLVVDLTAVLTAA